MRLSHIITFGLTMTAMAATVSSRAENKIPDEYKSGGFAIGLQAYTFNHFTLFEAIEKTAQAGGKVIEFFPGQKLSKQEPNVVWDHNASAETMQKVKEKLAEHKIKAVNYGVVGIPKDEAQARKVFEFAKTMGLRAVTTESVDALDTIEKMVKEYDIMVGFTTIPNARTIRITGCGTRITSSRWLKIGIPASARARTPATGCAPVSSRWSASGFSRGALSAAILKT